MKYADYIKSLSDEQLEAYASQVNTSANYLELHLLPARKVPRKDLMIRLADCAAPAVTRLSVLEHFYPEMFEVHP